VLAREIEGRTVVLRRRYDAPVADVWSAWTEPERLNRWFLPVTGDLRAGGSFSLQGNASGEVLRCEPPRLLRVTWAYADRPVDEVELRMEPDGDGTALELRHVNAGGLVEWQGERVDAAPGIGAGWELSLPYLERYLRGELPDKPGVEWFEFTPELIELDRRNHEAWKAISPHLVIAREVRAPRERVLRDWEENGHTATSVHFDEVEGGTRVTVFAGPYGEHEREAARSNWEAQIDALAARLIT
jgi:uncharacterized protein YndB with AHSA1/START domain